jgi:hypothetical protein
MSAMNILLILTSIISPLMTLIVIWYAREAVRESRRTTMAAKSTTEAAGQIVDKVAELLAIAGLYQKIYQLRDIGLRAESIFWRASEKLGATQKQVVWRTMDHNYLQQALIGIPEDELPHCRSLTQADPAHAMGDGSMARTEIECALKELMESFPGMI